MIIEYFEDIYSLNQVGRLWEATNTRNRQTFTQLCPGTWLDMHGQPMAHPALRTILDTAIASQQQRQDKQHKPRPHDPRPTYAPIPQRRAQRARARKAGNRL